MTDTLRKPLWQAVLVWITLAVVSWVVVIGLLRIVLSWFGS